MSRGSSSATTRGSVVSIRLLLRSASAHSGPPAAAAPHSPSTPYAGAAGPRSRLRMHRPRRPSAAGTRASRRRLCGVGARCSCRPQLLPIVIARGAAGPQRSHRRHRHRHPRRRRSRPDVRLLRMRWLCPREVLVRGRRCPCCRWRPRHPLSPGAPLGAAALRARWSGGSWATLSSRSVRPATRRRRRRRKGALGRLRARSRRARFREGPGLSRMRRARLRRPGRSMIPMDLLALRSLSMIPTELLAPWS